MLSYFAHKRVNKGGALSKHALEHLRLALYIAENCLFHIDSFHITDRCHQHRRVSIELPRDVYARVRGHHLIEDLYSTARELPEVLPLLRRRIRGAGNLARTLPA